MWILVADASPIKPFLERGWNNIDWFTLCLLKQKLHESNDLLCISHNIRCVSDILKEHITFKNKLQMLLNCQRLQWRNINVGILVRTFMNRKRFQVVGCYPNVPDTFVLITQIAIWKFLIDLLKNETKQQRALFWWNEWHIDYTTSFVEMEQLRLPIRESETGTLLRKLRATIWLFWLFDCGFSSSGFDRLKLSLFLHSWQILKPSNQSN